MTSPKKEICIANIKQQNSSFWFALKEIRNIFVRIEMKLTPKYISFWLGIEMTQKYSFFVKL